jgi:hypothetical protein
VTLQAVQVVTLMSHAFPASLSCWHVLYAACMLLAWLLETSCMVPAWASSSESHQVTPFLKVTIGSIQALSWCDCSCLLHSCLLLLCCRLVSAAEVPKTPRWFANFILWLPTAATARLPVRFEFSS